MKTFFSALILGIFIGSIITAYWSSPDSFKKLQESKSALLGQAIPAEDPAMPIEEPEQKTTPEPAAEVPMFKVATPKVNQEEEETDNEPLPGPIISSPTPFEPDTPPPVEETPAPAEPEAELEKTPLNRGKEKAEEFAELAKEKAIELHQKAEPYLNEGVDLAIASAIRAQFKLDKRIESDQLQIEVKNREVTLTGTVADGESKQVVIDIAMTTKGVMQVTPNIEIATAE